MLLQIKEIHACKQHVFDFSVFQRVVNHLAVTALRDYVGRTQKPKLMGTSGLVYAQNPRQVAHTHFAYAKCADDFVSRCVRACREKLGKRVKRCVARDIVDDGLLVDIVYLVFHT